MTAEPTPEALQAVDFRVGADDAGERVDKLIAQRTGIARNKLGILTVLADGKRVRSKDRLTAGVRVKADIWNRAAGRPEAEPSVPLVIIYEDADVIVVDKPAGVSVHPPAGSPDRGGTLVNALLARWPEIATLPGGDRGERPGIVHRIDRETSGLLVVARSIRGYEGLSEQIGARTVHREYAAFAGGRFDTTGGAIDAPIGRRPGSRYMSVRADGRAALSRYSVEAAWERPAMSAVTVTLETGRTHQIRVHLEAIGHCVIGDPAYRGSRIHGAKRQMLHAHRLAFCHPVLGDDLAFVSSLPRDMLDVLSRAGTPIEGQIPQAWIA